jgi:hypothetical protein
MSAMSEPPRDLAALSVEELRAALGRQRAVNTQLRMVLAAQAELHQAELAARDAQVAQLRSQVAVLAVLVDRVGQLERQAGRDSSNSSKPPSSDSPYTKSRARPPTGRCVAGRGVSPASSLAIRGPRWRRCPTRTTSWCTHPTGAPGVGTTLGTRRPLPSTSDRCSRRLHRRRGRW